MSSRARVPRKTPAGSAKAARNAVRQALKREHGFVVKTKQYDPPTYQPTPSIQFKQRVTTAVADTALNIKLSDVLTGGAIKEYKLHAVTAWAISAQSDNAIRLQMNYTQGSEVIYAEDVAGANHHAVTKICPPMDDWFVTGNANEPSIGFPASSNFDLIIDFQVLARLNLPVIEYTAPSGGSQEPAVTPQHSLRAIME